MSPLQKFVGKQFGRLMVQGIKREGKRTRFICKCDCGKETAPHAQAVRMGWTTSCGCFFRQKRREATTLHGMTKTLTFNSWRNILDRCYNKNKDCYPHYGGRGIIVCDSWKNSFLNFLKDMGERPSPKHSIDRIDVNGNYEPKNCRWVTQNKQIQNQRPRKNKSGARGVTVCKNRHCTTYRAALYTRREGKLVALFMKNFKTMDEAKKAYAIARKKFFGESDVYLA